MIESRQNQRIKDIRRLRRSKGDRALLEGPHLLRAALEADVTLESVLVTPELAADPATDALLEPLGAVVDLARADVLESLADADSPRGLLAVARLPRGGVEALPRSSSGVYVFADGLQEPGNLGALARVAEAAGAIGLALGPGSAHPNHPRALRASAGSLLRLPVARAVTLDRLEAHLEASEWWALDPSGGDDLYDATPASGNVVLMVGAEGPGLGARCLERADRRVRVPMRRPVESLNATVSAALVLYEIERRRRVSPPPP